MTATYERAAAGFDAEHERELRKAIVAAIFAASKVSDADVLAIRTSEITSALLDVLALTLALSPASSRTRQARRQLMLELGRRLQKRTAEACADPEVQDFLRHAFNGADVAGRA